MRIKQLHLQYLVQCLDQFILAFFLKLTTFMANNQRSIIFLDARWFFFWSSCSSLLLYKKKPHNSSAPWKFSKIWLLYNSLQSSKNSSPLFAQTSKEPKPTLQIRTSIKQASPGFSRSILPALELGPIISNDTDDVTLQRSVQCFWLAVPPFSIFARKRRPIRDSQQVSRSFNAFTYKLTWELFSFSRVVSSYSTWCPLAYVPRTPQKLFFFPSAASWSWTICWRNDASFPRIKFKTISLL